MLFGKLGTHSRLAGALLQLKDPFFSNRHGRKVVVEAPSRQVAASAITTLLFQLCHDLRVAAPLEQAQLSYVSPKDQVGGCVVCVCGLG